MAPSSLHRLALAGMVAFLVTIVAAAQPGFQTPATTGASNQLPVSEIVRLALARATAQDKAKTELRFESLVATTVESLNDEAEVTSIETTLHRRYPFDGTVYEELIARNGEPLSEADIRDEAKRRADFRRELQEAEAGGKVLETNDERQVRFNEDLMARYEAAVVGEDTVRGERCWAISFWPRDGTLPYRGITQPEFLRMSAQTEPGDTVGDMLKRLAELPLNFQRNTRIDRALNQSSGEVYVSQNDYGVVQIDFRLLQPVRYVWGLVASLSRLTGQLGFQRVAPDIWLPSSYDVRYERRIFFVTQRRHIVREWRERRPVSGNTG